MGRKQKNREGEEGDQEKKPSIYYVSTFLDFFRPACPPTQPPYWTTTKKDILCNPTPSPNADVMSGWSRRKLYFMLTTGSDCLTLHVSMHCSTAGLLSLELPGVPWHPQILADQLTVSQPGGRLCPPNNNCTPRFSELPTALSSI